MMNLSRQHVSSASSQARQARRQTLGPAMQATPTSVRVLPSVAPASIPLRRTLLAHRAREVGCRFQPSRINEITSTKSHSFSDQQSTRQGSVVLAWDGHRDAEKALKWTLNNLLSPGEAGETLDMVHVVCDPRGLLERTAVGSSPAGRLQMYDGLGARETSSSYQEYAERLLEGAHLFVQQRCADILHNCGVANQVHLPQLPCPRSASVIGQTLLQEAERLGARMLVVASHGPGAMSEYGSVARYCYQHASMPLVLIPSADRTYFGTASFDAPGAAGMDVPQAAMDPAMLQRREEGVSRVAPATKAHVKPHLDSAQDMPRGEHKHSQREVLLVVTNLHELEQHWQWVADNLCRQGDVLNIMHLHMSAPTSPAIQDCGYASLPTALAQVLRARGLADVKYSQHYFADENTSAEAAKKVVAAAEGDAGVRMVCLLNYSRQGMLMEAVRGSVASELARHCPVPLVLLQPAN